MGLNVWWRNIVSVGGTDKVTCIRRNFSVVMTHVIWTQQAAKRQRLAQPQGVADETVAACPLPLALVEEYEVHEVLWLDAR